MGEQRSKRVEDKMGVWHTLVSPALGEAEAGGLQVQACFGNLVRPHLKIKKMGRGSSSV